MRQIAKYYVLSPKTQPFSPLDLSPALWLDASDTATITASSGSVSQWDDKSGNGRHVSQATAANQPTTGVDTLNGLNVLSFAFDSLVSASFQVAQPFTTIFVFRTSSAAQQAFSILMDGARLGSGGRAIVFANASNIGNVSSMDAGTRVDTGALTTSTSYAWATTFNGASSSTRRGGVASTINPGTSGIASGVQISSAVVSTVSFTGTIAEVIVVGSTLTAQQMTDLATYISEKWGVTL